MRKTTAVARAWRLISLEGTKTGQVAAVELVDEEDEELLLISASRPGRAHRRPEHQPSTAAQARGVIVMRLNEGDEVAGIAVFRAENRDTDRSDRRMG